MPVMVHVVGSVITYPSCRGRKLRSRKGKWHDPDNVRFKPDCYVKSSFCVTELCCLSLITMDSKTRGKKGKTQNHPVCSNMKCNVLKTVLISWGACSLLSLADFHVSLPTQTFLTCVTCPSEPSFSQEAFPDTAISCPSQILGISCLSYDLTVKSVLHHMVCHGPSVSSPRLKSWQVLRKQVLPNCQRTSISCGRSQAVDEISEVISTTSPLLGVNCSSGSPAEGCVILQFSGHSFAADSMFCVFGCLLQP